MCGIAGFFHTNDSYYCADEITNSLIKSLYHRGPDSHGINIFFNNRIALAHTRLSILDLSTMGHQPMSFQQDRFSITYNGEIYNFLELKVSLEQKGYTFNSKTDTEVILAAYAEWGHECLHKFNGMWAFAIWDNQKKTLFLARDRFGIKPLYYVQKAKDNFSFSSELRAFLKSDHFDISLSTENLVSLLHDPNCLQESGLTIYNEILELPPGHFMEISSDLKISKFKKWWKLHEFDFDLSSESTNERFLELFRDSCALRMRSDVPLATALSGGLDSSATYSMIRQSSPRDKSQYFTNEFQSCFSMSFPESWDDESYYAQLVANSLKAEFHIVKNHANSFDELINATLDYSDISGTPLNCITPLYKSMASHGFKVSIDGHGGDECLMGYPDMIESALKIAPDSQKLSLSNTLSGMLHNPHYNPTHRIPFSAKTRIFAGKVKKSLTWMMGKTEEPAKPIDSKVLQRNHFPLPNRVVDHKNKLKELKTSFFGIHQAAIELERLPLILRNFDKASMLSGVEVRTPLLDYRLVEFCCNLPLSIKVNNGYTKNILRKSMDNRLPKEVVWRKHKVGINAPLQNWFENDRFLKSSQDLVREVENEASDMLGGKVKVGTLFNSINHDQSLTWFFMNLAILKKAL